jgi:DNA polymerase-3 subunit delta
VALNRAGAIVEVQSVPRAALPGWLEKRLARQKQSASREVLQYLADRVEGNLLAAHQELQKLALLAPEGELSLDTVREAVADVARYDTHVAAEALVAGDTARYLRVLEGLRGEGEAPTYLLFTVSSALFALATGERVNKAMQAVLESARRYPPAALERAIRRAAAVDRAIKGIGVGEPWEEFAKLGLELHASQ